MGVDHDVAWFHVSQNNTHRVTIADALEDLPHKPAALRHEDCMMTRADISVGLWPLLHDIVFQILAHILGKEVEVVIVVVDRVQAHHVWVVGSAQQAHLS